MKRLSQGKLNKKYYEEFVDRSKWEKELWQKRGNRVMEVQVASRKNEQFWRRKKNYIEMLTRKPNWGSKETSTERKKWIENKIEIYYLNQQECFDEVSR